MGAGFCDDLCGKCLSTYPNNIQLNNDQKLCLEYEPSIIIIIVIIIINIIVIIIIIIIINIIINIIIIIFSWICHWGNLPRCYNLGSRIGTTVYT